VKLIPDIFCQELAEKTTFLAILELGIADEIVFSLEMSAAPSLWDLLLIVRLRLLNYCCRSLLYFRVMLVFIILMLILMVSVVYLAVMLFNGVVFFRDNLFQELLAFIKFEWFNRGFFVLLDDWGSWRKCGFGGSYIFVG
jgi:hypothetical protein